MTARATRRISQPDSYHSAPNRSATTRATYSIATSHSDTTAWRSSTRASRQQKRRGRHPAHYRLRSFTRAKHCRESPFAARIRKAGRCPTAPLARRHPCKSSTKDEAGTPPLPLAQLPPSKHCRETPFAARIRKAGRCLTAPLAQLHPCKSSACRRPRPAKRQPPKDNSNGFESSEVNRRYRD